MVPMLYTFICMVIILLILNKIFNTNDVLKFSGEISRLEDLNKARTHSGSNRSVFFKTHFSVENYIQNCKLEELSVAQKKKKRRRKKEQVTCAASETRGDKAKASLSLLLPQSCNLWVRNHKINFTVMQKDEMAPKFAIVWVKLYFRALKMRFIYVITREMYSSFHS